MTSSHLVNCRRLHVQGRKISDTRHLAADSVLAAILVTPSLEPCAFV